MTAPRTFSTRQDAEGWLAATMRSIELGTWTPKGPDGWWAPPGSTVTLGQYARAWVEDHGVQETTRDLYRRTLEAHVLPALGTVPLTEVTPSVVNRWYASLAPGQPRARSAAYQRLRQVMGHAVEAGLVDVNPCAVKGAGRSTTAHDEEIATAEEMRAMWEAMPDRARLAILLAGLAALRSGELRELRRGDIDLTKRLIHVRRGVRRIGSVYQVGPTKSKKTRTVPIPDHLVSAIRDHIARFAFPGSDGLLFPRHVKVNEHLREQTFNNWWDKARVAAGRPAFRLHDLRHTALTWHQIAGATLAETMALAGHSTPEVAMRYQHAARSRLAELAERMPDLGLGHDPAG